MAATQTSLQLSINSLHHLISILSVKLTSTNHLIWKAQILPLFQCLGVEGHVTSAAPTQGYRCFPCLRYRASSKFVLKTYPCIFIGYSPIHKGFKCYHPPSRKVFISRHLVFNETNFPYVDPKSLFRFFP